MLIVEVAPAKTADNVWPLGILNSPIPLVTQQIEELLLFINKILQLEWLPNNGPHELYIHIPQSLFALESLVGGVPFGFERLKRKELSSLTKALLQTIHNEKQKHNG